MNLKLSIVEQFWDVYKAFDQVDRPELFKKLTEELLNDPNDWRSSRTSIINQHSASKSM